MEKKPLGESELQKLLLEYSQNAELDLILTMHAKEQMRERDIVISEVMRLLKYNFDLKKTQRAKDPDTGLFRYTISCPSLKRKGRRYGAVIIPYTNKPAVKVVTVMWEDTS